MVQPSLTGLDYEKLLSWYGFHEEHSLRNSSNIFPLFSRLFLKYLKYLKYLRPVSEMKL